MIKLVEFEFYFVFSDSHIDCKILEKNSNKFYILFINYFYKFYNRKLEFEIKI